MIDAVEQFMQTGGEVLYLITFVTFIMWTLLLERAWYYYRPLKLELAVVRSTWLARSEKQSWQARKIRRQMISQMKMAIYQHLRMIKVLVSLCPLCGLLGTVWGMIEVFNIMAVTGGGDVKAMAAGVSKATIPTMAGMVAALSGVFANTAIERIAHRETHLLEDSLILDD